MLIWEIATSMPGGGRLYQRVVFQPPLTVNPDETIQQALERQPGTAVIVLPLPKAELFAKRP